MVSSSTNSGKCNSINDQSAQESVTGDRYVLAHLSDPHFARVDQMGKKDFLNKRILGYLRWKLKRRFEHSDELLTILHKDLQRSKPDLIAVTGDLTQIGLPGEFKVAQNWLQTLGTADMVSVIPGNHDTYVQTDWHTTFAHWLDYMIADGQDADLITSLDGLFPTLRIRQQIALIGINTAYPCGPHLATGKIGRDQLLKLETILNHLSHRHLFRIILIHHPPIQGIVSRRRGLTDAAALRTVVERYGAELVLFGHAHKTSQHTLKTASGIATAIGAPSISSLGPDVERLSRYYLYTIISKAESWKLHMEERIFSLELHRFISGRQQDFSFPG